MLPVSPDHRIEVGAECRMGLILSEASYYGFARQSDGLLQIVGHLHPSHCLHLFVMKEKCYSWQLLEYVNKNKEILIYTCSSVTAELLSDSLRGCLWLFWEKEITNIILNHTATRWALKLDNAELQLTWMNPVYFLSISTSCWSALFLMLGSGSVPIAMR